MCHVFQRLEKEKRYTIKIVYLKTIYFYKKTCRFTEIESRNFTLYLSYVIKKMNNFSLQYSHFKIRIKLIIGKMLLSYPVKLT